MRRRRTRLSAVLLLAVLMVGAAGGGATARESPAQPVKRRTVATPTSTKKVTIVDFAFSPKRITISKGTRVRWANTGAVGHTSTSTTDKWDSGTIAAGDSFSRVFKKAGTFLYHCTIHATMKGKITVT